jgi:ABC-type multidrug transport system permease subunit
MFIMTLTFNGVMQPPNALPGFWIFMYRVSPLTYLIAGMTATGLHGRQIHCADAELSVFNPPAGVSCGSYLEPYLQVSGGQLYNPAAMSGCQFCQLQNADQYLSASNICEFGSKAICYLVFVALILTWAVVYSERWRNFGLGWAYIGFNVAGTVMLYYMFRVKHYNPTSLVRGIGKGASFLCRVFKRRSGQTPKGKEANNGRLV